jgi:3-oxoacyl-[acyl-carrier-protein] synthase III
MTLSAHVIGWGKYVPPHVLTNKDLARRMDTSDDWIRSRTGIGERRIAQDGETTASMAIRAAQQALEVAGLPPAQVELVVVATATPDHAFPSTACLVQDAVGAVHAAAFDLSAGCTGFVYALSVVADMIKSGAYANALVIGAEMLSCIVNWDDRATCVLFGDGAGAVVVQANGADGGVLSSVLGADGSGGDLLRLPAGGSWAPASHRTVTDGLHYLQMKGREVFRFAVRVMPEATRQVLEKAGLAVADVSLIVPHQANQRIIDAAARALDVAPELVFSNLARYGNTSAASIPIALCEAVEAGRVQRDDLVVCVGFGAGLTWGATAIRWSMPLPPTPLPRWKRVGYRLIYLHAALRSWVRRLLRRVFALRVKEWEDDVGHEE